MKAILPLLIGLLLGAALTQWYIIATREPMSVLCDGGEEGEPIPSPAGWMDTNYAWTWVNMQGHRGGAEVHEGHT